MGDCEDNLFQPMELNLSRVDYARVSMERVVLFSLLPPTEKESFNKVVLVDSEGGMEIATISNDQINPQTKVKLNESCLKLVMAGKPGKEKNRIFIATEKGNILGFSHKAKKSFEMESDFSEPIKSFHVHDTDIFLVSDYTYRHFHKASQLEFYMSPEKLNAVQTLVHEGVVVAVVACVDGRLKIMKDSEVESELNLNHQPCCLALLNGNGGQDGNLVLYGCTDGSFGLASMERHHHSVLWHTKSPINHHGSITCLSFDPLSAGGNGVGDGGMGVREGGGESDLLLGYDDGWVEIYRQRHSQTPTMAYSICLSESIVGLEAGRFGEECTSDVVCLTYSGWLIGLTSGSKNAPNQSTTQALNQIINHSTNQAINQATKLQEDLQQIQELKEEIKELKKEVEQKHQINTGNISKSKVISSAVGFSMTAKFQFQAHLFCYVLQVECHSPIDFLLLESTTLIDIIDSGTDQCIPSSTPCHPQDDNALLMTFRCHANVSRLDIKVVPKEGSYGSFRVYVVSKLHPKHCLLEHYNIKPLSMHSRMYGGSDDADAAAADAADDDNGADDDGQEEKDTPTCIGKKRNKSLNHLRLKGNFSYDNIHSWLSYCFWEFPKTLPTTTHAAFTFSSAYMNTSVKCAYRQGDIKITSENLSTLGILKDVLTKLATKSGIKLEIFSEVNDETVLKTVRGIAGKVDEMVVLAKKVQLIDALKEVDSSGVSLVSEFNELLLQSDSLLQQHQQQLVSIDKYFDLIHNLYVDWFKWRGESSKGGVEKLKGTGRNIKQVIQFFEETLRGL